MGIESPRWIVLLLVCCLSFGCTTPLSEYFTKHFTFTEPVSFASFPSFYEDISVEELPVAVVDKIEEHYSELDLKQITRGYHAERGTLYRLSFESGETFLLEDGSWFQPYNFNF